MENAAEKTTVIILGTGHFGEKEAPKYINTLKGIIREINPDIICLEWPAKHSVPNANPPVRREFSDAVVPTALEIGAIMVPLEPEGAIREALLRPLKEINEKKGGDTEAEKMIWEYDQDLTKSWVEKYRHVFNDWDAFEYFQARVFDVFFYEAIYPVFRKYFPKLTKWWDDYNEFMLAGIEKAIQQFSGKRILVTVGLDHKHWLWNRLESRSDIVLHDLHSFRKARGDG